MVDANSKHIPAMGHMFRLRIEVSVNCLGDNLNIGLLATLELRLDFFWQCNLVGELPPAPISTCAVLWGRPEGILRWALKSGGLKSLSTICRNFNPADATATTRPGYS